MGIFIRRITVPPYMENVYIVGDEDTRDAVVIDPGAEGPQVLYEVTRQRAKVRYIVNTHGHVDHTGAVAPVREGLKVPFGLHEGDLFLLRPEGTQFGRVNIPGFQAPPQPDFYLHDGDSLEVGPFTIEVIATPGHTPGSVSFRVGDQVFSGDTLFEGSVGRFDLPGGSGPTLLRSIQERLLPLPDDTKVWPGHGRETTMGRERKSNPFLQERNRAAFG